MDADTMIQGISNCNGEIKKSKRNKKRKLLISENADITIKNTNENMQDINLKIDIKNNIKKMKLELEEDTKDMHHLMKGNIKYPDDDDIAEVKNEDIYSKKMKSKRNKKQNIYDTESMSDNIVNTIKCEDNEIPKYFGDTILAIKQEEIDSLSMSTNKKSKRNKKKNLQNNETISEINENIAAIKAEDIDNLFISSHKKQKSKRNKTEKNLENESVSDHLLSNIRSENDETLNFSSHDIDIIKNEVTDKFSVSTNKKSRRNKKTKLKNSENILDSKSSASNEEVNRNEQEVESKKKKQSKNNKIKFNNEDNAAGEQNKPKYLFGEEAEVKDEDIDQFCEELDEEDNKQYENWVKLFEERFRPKKVKHK